ncbi:MAG: long-chain-fatty-acid--CoA ligase [Candidatus Baldrarchaeia archaeon]
MKGSRGLPDYVINRIWEQCWSEDAKRWIEKIGPPPEDVDIVAYWDRRIKEELRVLDEVAMVFYGYNIQMTYREFMERRDRFATALHELGIRKGDKVAVYLPNCPQFAIAAFGALRIGATITCVNPLFAPREVQFQLSDSESRVVVTTDTLYPKVKAVKEDTPLEHVIVLNLRGEKPKVEKEPGVLYFDEMIEKASPKPPKVEIDPKEDIAVLQYTGGTTGIPKGCMLTHYNVLSNAWQMRPIGEVMKEKLGIERLKRLCVLPWYHIYGQTCDLVGGLGDGELLVIFDRFDPGKVLDAIQQYKPHIFLVVTPILLFLLQHPKIREVDFSSLKLVNAGAAPLPVEIAKQWKEITGVEVQEGYGLSEASPVTHTTASPFFATKIKLGSAGVPLPWTLEAIVDPETLEFLPLGETGELVVAGPQVMKGYWKRPDETEKVFFEAGGIKWLRTGDVAKIDEEGFVWIVDRVKEIIKYKGHSVYPREVEEVLYEHPAVIDAAVVGVPDPVAGENIKAFVVLKPEYRGKVTEQEIIEWCKERLAAYKYPRMVEFVTSIPRSAAGKVLRRVLRQKEIEKMKKEQK